jgi:hypothetical protein
MKTELVKIKEVKTNPNNPRFIKDDKFKKLVKSIKEFPEMLELRPIVVDKYNIVIGGNMRLRACKEAGLKEVHIVKADQLTEEQQREFIIKDNVGFGEWDWDDLANKWDTDKLEEWGLDLPINEEKEDETYTSKIESPIYEPTGKKPNLEELYNLKGYNKFIEQINKSKHQPKLKEFLKYAATRFIEFNYRNIAEYYSHSDKEIKVIIEDLAMVIVDYDKAIEKGFVKLFDTLENLAEIDE